MSGGELATWFVWMRTIAALSFVLSWLLVWLFQRYIIRRYEEETALGLAGLAVGIVVLALSPFV